MRIAVIGSGISGLSCAHYLSTAHEVSVFEAGKTVGGHTATVDVKLGTRRYAIDTGFIVFNDWTYPNFIALMDSLGVPSKPTTMGFSVRDEQSGLEYSGTNLDSLFAQRGNLLSWRFLTMVRDILRFNKESVADLDAGRVSDSQTLGEYLERNRYSEAFKRQYLAAMGSAIWSANCATILDFPLNFFLRFFRNHGLLSVQDRPTWRVIEGGSREYLRPLCQRFEQRIFTGCAVARIRRQANQVTLVMADGRNLQLRPGSAGHPLRPGAGNAGRAQSHRAGYTRCTALPGQRRSAAHRYTFAAAQSQNLVELELLPGTRP